MTKNLLKFLFTFLLFVFPLGQLERIPLGNPQIGLYFHDLIIVIILLYWLGRKIIYKEKFKLGTVEKTVLAFFTAALFSFLLNSFKHTKEEILVASLYLLRWGNYAGLYFVIREKYTRHPEPCRMRGEGFPVNTRSGICQRFFAGAQNDGRLELTELLIVVGSAAAVFGLLQYIFYPDIRPLTVFEWDPHYYRVVGTFLEPGFAGLIFVLTMILIFGQLDNFIPVKAGIHINRIFYYFYRFRIKCGMTEMLGFIIRFPRLTTYYLLLTTCYIAFALTYSRSAYLSFLVAMGVIAYFKKSWRFFAVVFATFVSTLLVLPRPGGEGVKLERQASVSSRVTNWEQAFVIFKTRPFFGAGFNFYRYVARDHGFLDKNKWPYSHAGAGADNSFLFVMSTAGILGLFFYLLMIFKILLESAENLKTRKSDFVIFTSTVAIFVHAFFNNSFFYPWVMIWFWMLLGVYGV